MQSTFKFKNVRPIAFFYSIKIWLSSVFIAPLLFFIMGLVQEPAKAGELTGIFRLYILFVFVQFLFSLLTWLIFWIIIELILHNINGMILAKCLISIIGAVLTIATFHFFPLYGGDDFSRSFDPLMLANMICIIAGIWIFKLPRTNPSLNNRLPEVSASDGNPCPETPHN